MILTHGTAQYRVGKLVGSDAGDEPKYRLYICEDVATGTQYLLQVATDLRHNGGLERAAFVLRGLKRTSDLFEAEYAKQDAGRLLDYDRLFPGVVDSFVAADQGRRQINILSLKDVDTVSEMVPLSNLASRDNVRVELPSSAWIMGRLLKLLEFIHGDGISVRMLSGNNVLIHPERHFVVVLDWSSALTFPEKVPADDRREEIAKAARTVFVAIGGNQKTGIYPYETGDDKRYVDFIWRLACGRENNAERAHTQFYELITELFGRTFRPFQCLPR